jgi:uncharacterized protein (DUF433 family)
MAIITRDDEVLGGEPRIRGTRVGVRHVLKLIRDGGFDIATTAEQLDIDNADVQSCIEYYDANREEMAALEADESDLVAAAAAEGRGGDR